MKNVVNHALWAKKKYIQSKVEIIECAPCEVLCASGASTPKTVGVSTGTQSNIVGD